MGAILSKFWPNKSTNSNSNNQPQLAITGPPPRLPLPSPPPRPPSSSPPVDKPSDTGEDKSSTHGRKSSKKHQQQQQSHYKQQVQQQQLQQQSSQQLEKPLGKNALPLSNQSFIYKTVFEATVSDVLANEEEARITAAEAPGPFEIETDLLSPEVEEAVIKIQANVRGYLTRKQYRGVTPDRSVETSQQPTPSVGPSQEPIESSNQPKSSSGIFAPPPSFSDTPKEFPLDNDDNQTATTAAANQGKKIAEKLIELEKQVNQAINKPLESTPTPSAVDDVIVSERRENFNSKQSPVDCADNGLKSQYKNQHNVVGDHYDNHDESISSNRPLEIPSIETSGPEEAAIKIQAAFRGYQVRKSISRETSPCHQSREGGEDGAGGVHLREKDYNATQDSERESILVLNQLEECLSQELMRSSINLEDETSLSSYSTDIDLNASLQSNTSLMGLTSLSSTATKMSTHDDEISDLKSASIGDLLETDNTMIDNQLEKTTISDEPSITTTIPDTIKSYESLNNEQIVAFSPSDSSLISTINQVTISTDECPANQSVDCLDSSAKVEDTIETTIKTEPVIFVPSGEKVNAIEGTVLVADSSKNDQEIDPVVIVEVNGTLDASLSSNISKSNDQAIKDLKSIEPESSKQSTTLTTETIETKSESTQLIDVTTKSQVDCESKVSLINETTPSTHFNQPTEEIDEPEIEPLFFDMISPLTESTVDNSNQLIVTNDNPVNLTENPEQIISITSTIPEVKSSPSLPKTVTSDKQSDLNNESISVIDASAQESHQKVIKLIKEDSFGSDILILGDEKSDTLYDPFADDLTTAISSSVNQESTVLADDEQLTTSPSFVDDNLIKSVVDDINKDEGLLLYEIASKTTTDNQTSNQRTELPDTSEDITEVKDDILVNLDESDEEDDDSQKRPVSESINSNSTIRINIQRPSDAQEVEQLLQQKSKDLNDSVLREGQLTGQSSGDNLVEENEIISTPKQLENETTIHQSTDSASDVQLTADSVSSSPSVEQPAIDHDKSSIDDGKISTNPFTNQPDFDSDIKSGKINLNGQGLGDSIVGQTELTSLTTKQPSQEKELTIQQLASTSPKEEVITSKEDEKSLEKIVPQESRSINEDNQPKTPDESLIGNEKFKVQIVETTDLKPANSSKDAELSTKQINEDNSSDIQEIQDNLKETLIVLETESSNQSTSTEKLTTLESSTETDSSASSSTVNQPAVIIEPIDVGNVEQKVPTINESSVNDEPESRPEEEGDDASSSDANLFLRLQQDRETRSRSPNPFGRKKRRQKKNRGGGANN